MRVNITANTCTIDNNVYLNAGEYNINKFYFTFSEEYLDEYVKKALFIDKAGTPIEMVIANNECDIPYDILKNPGTYTFGVYAYEMNGTELVLRYSPEPTHFYVNKGSYMEDGTSPTEPTPDEFAQYYQAMQDLIANAKPELIDYIDDNLPTVDIGGTSTLEPGSEATVINVGTDRKPVFVFGIPKGDPGTTDYNELENRPDLSVYALIRESANKIALDIDNETFKMKAKIFDKNDNLISESNIIDLPLESVVVSGEYDSQTQKLILTLENGNTIEVPLSGLVSGLVSEEELTNRLNTAIKIETISKNGTRVPIYNKNVDISVPSSTNELINNSGFITKDVTNLTHYYDKVASDTRYPLVGESANNLTMDLDNTTYVLTATLKDRNNRAISVQRITFPFESIFTSISNLSSTKADVTDLTSETLARQNADTGLQNQIDAITSASDVVDVVSTYSDLSDYDTTKLTDKDVIKVMQDENHNNAISYYRWDEPNEEFTYVGSEGPFYTKGETDTLLNGKVDNSTLDNYVQFTDHATTDKAGVVVFGQGFEKGLDNKLRVTGYNYSFYNGSMANTTPISKQTLENVITGKNLETANNKVTTIDENSTDTQYPSAKCVYDSQTAQDTEIDTLKMIYNILPTDYDTGETISIDNTGEMPIKSTSLGGNTSQVVIPAETGTNIDATSINISDVNTSKEHTIGIDGNINQLVIPAETGTNVNATSISISDVDTDKEHYFELDGNTYQKTTTGKNVITSRYSVNTSIYSYNIDTNLLKNTMTYSFISSLATNATIYVRSKNNNDYVYDKGTLNIVDNAINTITFNLTNEEINNLKTVDTIIQIYKPQAGFADGTISKAMLEEGSTATSYEPYTYGASPNPSYPQNIEVVTGENDIIIEGKNLLDNNGLLNATFTTSVYKYTNANFKGNRKLKMRVSLKTGKSNLSNLTLALASYGANPNSGISSFGIVSGSAVNSAGLIDYTGIEDLYISFYPTTYTWEEIINTYDVWVSTDSDIDTYTEYQPIQTYPVSLTSKNLLNITASTQVVNGVTFTINEDKTITVNGTPITGNAELIIGSINCIAGSTYKYVGTPTTGSQSTYASGVSGINLEYGTGITFTPNNDNKYNVIIRIYNGYTANNLLFKPMASTDTTITYDTYEPYYTPIELCKIDTYKDRIYKSNDKWYLEKNIGKVVLDGSENWARLREFVFNLHFPSATYPTNQYNIMDCLCDNFTRRSEASTWNNFDYLISYQRDSNALVFRNIDTSTKEDWTTWLSTHNTTVYYAYSTPTTTEITASNYPTLYSQLNALYNSTLYSTTNINTETSNLLPYIDLTYNVVTPSPSPNRPSNIDIVAGENDITIEGKNLCPTKESAWEQGNINGEGDVESTTSLRTKGYIPMKNDTNYHISVQDTTNYCYRNIRFYDRELNQIGNLWSLDATIDGATDKTINIPSNSITNLAFARIVIRRQNSLSLTASEITTIKPQIELGTSSTTFEEYISQTYPISLSSKNLWNYNATPNDGLTSHGITYTINNDGSITLNGTSTDQYIGLIYNIKLPAGTYYIGGCPSGGSNTGYSVAVSWDNGSYITVNAHDALMVPFTLTEEKTVQFWAVRISRDVVTFNNTTFYPMLYTVNDNNYASYYPPIELCKIGTYKDRIYKNNDKWYLEKNINKDIFDGSNDEMWNYESSTTTPTNRTVFAIYYGSTVIANNYYSNRFIYQSETSNRIVLAADSNKLYLSIDNQIADINTSDTNNEKLNKFINWLTNNNVILYKIKNAATTEITDTTLVSQLNALYNSTLYATTNINTETSNLLPYIDLQYNVVTPSPSPSRPSVVNVVKGENTLTICGKNLFNVDNFISAMSTDISITKVTYLEKSALYIKAANANKKHYYLSCKPSTQYTLSLDVASAKGTGSGYLVIEYTDGTNSSISLTNLTSTYTTKTLTSTSGKTISSISLQCFSIASNEYYFANIQLEKASTASTYEPYKSQTYPINLPSGMELCKIDTYQDRIYSNNGKFYLEKNTTTLTITGNESNTYFKDKESTNTIRFSILNIMNTNNPEMYKCSRFKCMRWYDSIYADIDEQYISQSIASSLTFNINKYLLSSLDVNGFKNWLNNNNTTIYIPLATPTTTEITDTTLITQLDNLQKAISYDSQTNISQTNEDKPFIITAEMFLSLKSIFD